MKHNLPSTSKFNFKLSVLPILKPEVATRAVTDQKKLHPLLGFFQQIPFRQTPLAFR